MIARATRNAHGAWRVALRWRGEDASGMFEGSADIPPSYPTDLDEMAHESDRSAPYPVSVFAATRRGALLSAGFLAMESWIPTAPDAHTTDAAHLTEPSATLRFRPAPVVAAPTADGGVVVLYRADRNLTPRDTPRAATPGPLLEPDLREFAVILRIGPDGAETARRTWRLTGTPTLVRLGRRGEEYGLVLARDDDAPLEFDPLVASTLRGVERWSLSPIGDEGLRGCRETAPDVLEVFLDADDRVEIDPAEPDPRYGGAAFVQTTRVARAVVRVDARGAACLRQVEGTNYAIGRGAVVESFGAVRLVSTPSGRLDGYASNGRNRWRVQCTAGGVAVDESY